MGTNSRKSSKGTSGAAAVPERSDKRRKADAPGATARAADVRKPDSPPVPPATTASTSAVALSPEDRVRRINELAYQLAEERGFQPGGEMDDWLRAEHLIDQQRG